LIKIIKRHKALKIKDLWRFFFAPYSTKGL
jgi:hypothetical protein